MALFCAPQQVGGLGFSVRDFDGLEFAAAFSILRHISLRADGKAGDKAKREAWSRENFSDDWFKRYGAH